MMSILSLEYSVIIDRAADKGFGVQVRAFVIRADASPEHAAGQLSIFDVVEIEPSGPAASEGVVVGEILELASRDIREEQRASNVERRYAQARPGRPWIFLRVSRWHWPHIGREKRGCRQCSVLIRKGQLS